MKVTNALNRNSVIGFVLFLAATLFAFWPTYFERLDEMPTYHFHLHGIVMLLWLALLIVQAFLIRAKRRPLHRSLGKLSYVLAPLVVAASLHLLHFRLRGIPPAQLPEAAFYFVALIVNALVAFAVLYGLAIVYKRNAALHARFMISTLFPLFTPVTDRIIGANFQSIVGLVPVIGGSPVLPVAGFLLADVILLVLAIWDLRAKERVYAFPIALIVLLMYHVSVLTFHQVPAWQAFCRWFVQLPLS
jgi:uncharacterized membrane protein YozB (DUF420 family)